jgi:type IV pilus assembly protein PilY1
MKKIKLHRMLLVFFSAFLMAISAASADDTDVYRTSVKNNAMLLIDTSGSMSWPVYDENENYANFMRWMRDPNGDGDTSDALAYDDGDCDPNGAEEALGCGNGNCWWDQDASATPNDYDRIDPNRIYLVSTYVQHNFINYTDSEGNPRESSTIDDIMMNTGSDTDPNYDARYPMLAGGVFAVYDSSGNPWTISDASSIDTTTVSGDQHVVFPSDIRFIDGTAPSAPWNSIINNYGNTLLPNAQDIALSHEVTDALSGVVTNIGFVGFLKSSGYYFSGFFEKDTSTHYQFTDNRDDAVHSYGGHRVYLFVTGNFLNFIKLVEDFKVNGMPDAACASGLPSTYSGQTNRAWMSICDKSGVSGGGTEVWNEVAISRIQNQQYGSDYSSGRNETNGTIDLAAYGNPKSLKVYFSQLDVENYWHSGSCSCSNTRSQNDGVFLEDQNGNVLTMVSSPESASVEETSGGLLYGCDGSGWTGVYDVDGVTSITVKFHVGSSGGNNCNGSDYGYRITKIKYSSFAPGGTVVTGEPEFKCCNGADGEGFKIKSRMDVAKNAMKHVIEETSDQITWGLTRFNGTNGGTVLSPLGTSVDTILTQIEGLNPSGSTPLGEAAQDAYNSDYTYLHANSSAAACSQNYIVVMTDGFPNYDTDWSRINDSTATSYANPTFGYCATGYGTCGSYGDADNWTFGGDANHMDDAAYWMYHKATYKHTIHSISFGLDNPMLADVADSSAGRYISAYNEQQVISAFYSLGLSMSASVAFTAPVVSVDEANRTQSGDKLYMAFFKPVNGDHWQGNLKKYGLNYQTRTDCGRSEPEWTVVDKSGFLAGNCDGSFKTSSQSYWSDSNDGGEVDRGGAGGKLKSALDAIALATGPYYDFRDIYTYNGSALVAFNAANVSNGDLDVTADEDRYKIINFMYGYTFAAQSDGKPVAKRTWVLGDMIHSEPRIIDYVDATGDLEFRFVAIGANDGMLHVFLDSPVTTTIDGKAYSAGQEIFAFVPSDLLPNLKLFEDTDVHPYTVDGSCNLFRATTKTGDYYDKTLVFGERRGGMSYWALDVTEPDPSLWTVKWHIQGGSGDYSEMGYSWNKPFFAKIRTASDTVKEAVIFSGGYDPLEDGYPEAFDDTNGDGVRESGETYTDTGGGTNGSYDKYNPGKDTMGRGIFVVDLSDGSLLFKAVYGDADNDGDVTEDVTTGINQQYCKMTYCFPADVSVIPFSETKIVMYAADIYGQIWKITYDYYADMAHAYADADSTKWQVKRIFTANPGSSLAGDSGDPAVFTAGDSTLNTGDQGRKMFYSPDVSYFGNCWTSKPVLYFGTGDRAHPRYAMTSNRFYVVADHNTLTNENDLLNLTCDELDQQADSNGDGTVNSADTDTKNALMDILSDESICSGFYRVMDAQGSCSGETVSHTGEKILSQPTVFFKNVYFTSYKPVFDDPCNPNGNAFSYALDYCWGTSVFNYQDEGTGNPTVRNIRDTYLLLENSSIPSGVRVVTRGGHAAGLISVGGAVSGVGEDQSTNIPGPPGGVSQILWETR